MSAPAAPIRDRARRSARTSALPRILWVIDVGLVVAFGGVAAVAAWPIYRDAATDADGVQTLASAVFDAGAATLSVYRANPKTSAPVYVFDVPRATTPAAETSTLASGSEVVEMKRA